MEQLNFSICHLLVSKSISDLSVSELEEEKASIPPDLGFPSKETLMSFFDGKEDKYNKEEEIYFIKKTSKKDNYFWLCIEYGSTKPRSKNVYDTQKAKKKENPRAKGDAELLKQLFCLYSFTQHKLYISNIQRTKFLETYLFTRWKKRVVIKRCFKPMEETIKLIKKVKKLEFKARNIKDLLSENKSAAETLFGKVLDILGLDDQKVDLTLNINYKKLNIREKGFAGLRKFIGMAREQDIKGLILTGLDNQDRENVFRLDSFIKKIPLSIEKDTGGLYDPEEVVNALIEEIEEQE